MTEEINMDRRNFIQTAAATAVGAGLAGCSGDENGETNNQTSPEQNQTTPEQTDTPEEDTTPEDENGEDEEEDETTPEEDYTTFEELYEQATRTPIDSTNYSLAGQIDFDDVEAMLSDDNTEAENVAIAATQASHHIAERDDNPGAIRWALDELDLNAYADNRTAYSGGEVTITEIYAENDDGTVQKVMVTDVPGNSEDPLGYSLIAGEEPQDEGPVADDNLQSMWNNNPSGNSHPLSFTALQNAVEDAGEDGIAWDRENRGNDNIILGDMDGEADVGYTWEGGLYLTDLEDIRNESHDEAFEAFQEINEFYANEVPDDEFMIIHAEDGELDLHTVGEDKYEEAVQGLNYEP